MNVGKVLEIRWPLYTTRAQLLEMLKDVQTKREIHDALDDMIAGDELQEKNDAYRVRGKPMGMIQVRVTKMRAPTSINEWTSH